MQPKRRSGSGWFGWLIFILIIFGSRLLPPVANWLSQVTGLPINTGVLIAFLVMLSIVAPLIGNLLRGIGQAGSGNETRLPTGSSPSPGPPVARPPAGLPPSSPSPSLPSPRLPPTSTQLPQANRPSGQQQIPGAPRFEPIIDSRIVVIGVVGLILIGGIFFVVLLSVGALP